MADQSLIEVVARAVGKATDEFVRGLAPTGMSDDEYIARSALRAILEHGPTPRMLACGAVTTLGESLDDEGVIEVTQGKDAVHAAGWATASELFHEMLRAELEGSARG